MVISEQIIEVFDYLFEKFGITTENVVKAVKSVL